MSLLSAFQRDEVARPRLKGRRYFEPQHLHHNTDQEPSRRCPPREHLEGLGLEPLRPPPKNAFYRMRGVVLLEGQLFRFKAVRPPRPEGGPRPRGPHASGDGAEALLHEAALRDAAPPRVQRVALQSGSFLCEAALETSCY
jgi:hypothetical protein